MKLTPNNNNLQLAMPPSGRRISIAPLIILLIFTSTLTAAAALLFSFNLIDHQAEQDLRSRIEVALEIEAKRLEDILSEYTYWDEAHENTIVEVDDCVVDAQLEQIARKHKVSVTGHLLELYGVCEACSEPASNPG